MIKEGDLVFLKSGGPEMTVGKIEDEMEFYWLAYRKTGRKLATCYYWYEEKSKDLLYGYIREKCLYISTLELSQSFEGEIK